MSNQETITVQHSTTAVIRLNTDIIDSFSVSYSVGLGEYGYLKETVQESLVSGQLSSDSVHIWYVNCRTLPDDTYDVLYFSYKS